MLDVRIALEAFIDDSKRDHDGGGRCDQPEDRGDGARRALEVRSDRDRHVDDVGAGQELAEAEEFGELRPCQPAAALDDHAACHR